MKSSKPQNSSKKDNLQPAKALIKSGHRRFEDLALLEPTGHEDRSKIHPLAGAPIGEPFLAELICDEQRSYRSGPRRTLVIQAHDETDEITIRFHNFNPGTQRMLAAGSRIRVFGAFETRRGGGNSHSEKKEMVHPLLLSAEHALPDHLTPVYRKPTSMSAAQMRREVQQACQAVLRGYPELPETIRKDSGTLPLAESLRLLHIPRKEDLTAKREQALESLKHDEWLASMIRRRQQKLKLRRREAAAIPNREADIAEFAKQLPFELTGAQQQAMAEIGFDLRRSEAMRRLLHGDVGCGKTLVAAFACWLAARANHRSTIMCPTVILACQHHALLTPIFENLGVNCVLLLGQTKAKERRQALRSIAENPNTVVIGTHSLFQSKTKLPDLRLAVIDEQQRFGVKQRTALERKDGCAHVLMLSATPIPRTLELGMFAHIDVSRMLERPRRNEIRTMLISSARAREVLDRIVNSDLQAYWICPLIKKSENSELRAAEEAFGSISKLAPELNAKLIHGKMGNEEKIAAIRSFQDGSTRMLVATTVVEVGIDAPEADVIVIDHCERLGLSQLHQLRGRVGRGKKVGFCALLYEPGLSAEAQSRLAAVHKTTDGFEIARADLRQRGPGDLIGKRQSGERKYKFASYDDPPIFIEQAKKEADALVESQPEIAAAHMRLWLGVASADKKSALEKI